MNFSFAGLVVIMGDGVFERLLGWALWLFIFLHLAQRTIAVSSHKFFVSTHNERCVYNNNFFPCCNLFTASSTSETTLLLSECALLSAHSESVCFVYGPKIHAHIIARVQHVLFRNQMGDMKRKQRNAPHYTAEDHVHTSEYVYNIEWNTVFSFRVCSLAGFFPHAIHICLYTAMHICTERWYIRSVLYIAFYTSEREFFI